MSQRNPRADRMALAEELLIELGGCRITLTVDAEGRLRWRRPYDAVTQVFRQRICFVRPEIIAILDAPMVNPGRWRQPRQSGSWLTFLPAHWIVDERRS